MGKIDSMQEVEFGQGKNRLDKLIEKQRLMMLWENVCGGRLRSVF